MQEFTTEDYKRILTEVIKKQLAILGPQITIAKAQSVAGLTVDTSGNVSAITGDPQVVMQALIDQFVQLSGLIVKKTLEPLYFQHTDGTTHTVTPAVEKPALPPVPEHIDPVVIQPTHLDMPQTINAQSGETQKAVDMQHIIDEAAKGA